MTHQHINKCWNVVWKRAGRVALRTKIFGIVITATSLTGFSVVLWTNSQLNRSEASVLAERHPFEIGELLGVTIIAMTIGLIIAWFLTEILARQVLEVTRVAQAVQQGNLARRAPVWADDEIGVLARTFNAMIDTMVQSRASLETSNAQLETHNAALVTLYELLAHAAQSMDRHTILTDGLSRLLAVIKAESGSILLRNKGGTFAEHVTHQLPPPLLDTLLRCASDDPLLSAAIKSAEPRHAVISALSQQQSALWCAAESCGFADVLVVPLQSRGTVNGLVVMFRRDPPSKPSTDKNMLFSTIANQLSVAVENATLWDELKHKNAMRTRLLAKAVNAQEQERERISRELHDETGQALTALLVQLKVLESLPDKEAMLAHTAELRQIVLAVLEEVRRLARDLRPSTLDELGLIPTLDWHIRTFTRNTNLDVEYEVLLPEDTRLPVHTELALYRVVQEALTNIVRHARATRALIRIEEQVDILRITVSDNGCGFDTNTVLNIQEHGMGLMSIQERVDLIGGTLTLNSVIGRGTYLSVEVPIQDKAAIT